MTYEHEDHHYDRVPVSPYYETNIYLDGSPNGIAIGKPGVKLSVSDDEGNQNDIHLDATTVRNLRLALHRAERWMGKVAADHQVKENVDAD